LEEVMLGLTNNQRVVPDKDGPALINRIAAEIAAIDPLADCPHHPTEARALLERLQSRMVRVPTGEALRAEQYSTAYNGALRDLARAKRCGLYPRDFMLPQPPSNCTPDALGQLQHQISELGDKLEEHESKSFKSEERTPEQLRIQAIERRLDKALPAIIDHHNALVASVNALEAKLSRLEAVMAIGPRLVQPALTAVEGHPDLIEKRESP
jgi:hypothetical protein